MRNRYPALRRQLAEEDRQFASIHLRAGLIFLAVCSVLLILYSAWQSGVMPFFPVHTETPGSIVSDIPLPETAESVSETESAEETAAETENVAVLPPETAGIPTEPLFSDTKESETETPPETEAPIPSETGYDYTRPVPQSAAVDDSYFNDAVFFGDSRIHGFCLYSGLNRGFCCAAKGLSTLSVFTEKVFEAEDGTKITPMEQLAAMEFGKIYIMLGINETGWPKVETFYHYYAQVIDAIRELNPQAAIYVLSVLPVSKSVSDTHPYVKNDRIAAFNESLAELTAEKEVYYIDLSPLADGEDGTLSEEASADGIHLSRAYCQKWLELLRIHTVVS